MHKWEILSPGLPIYTNVGFLGFCNVVLLQIDGHYAIIDPGHYGNREYVLKALQDRGVRPDDIDYVILTHAHYDHAINTLLFNNAIVYISKSEYEYSISSNDPYEVPFILQLVKSRLVLVDDGFELHGIKFVSLPGHTAGSMGVLLDDGTLIAGDAIKYVAEGITKSTTFAYYSTERANQSIAKALNLAHMVVPGHDLPFLVKDDKRIEISTNKANELIIYLRGKLNLTINADI